MARNLKMFLTTAAVLAALAGGTASFAQSDGSDAENRQSGSNAQGMQNGGMMNMGGMHEMMEKCRNMMAGMHQEEPEAPAPEEATN